MEGGRPSEQPPGGWGCSLPRSEAKRVLGDGEAVSRSRISSSSGESATPRAHRPLESLERSSAMEVGTLALARTKRLKSTATSVPGT